MATALISLGANLGDRAGTLAGAIRDLQAHPQIAHVAKSSFHETAAVGGPAEQPEFLNAAALLETSLAPHELLAVLQGIELQFGRERCFRWAARTLDLDLLLYGDLILEDSLLTIPHPRMAYRRFVLEPAAEAAPEMRHPQFGWTVAELLQHLNTAPNYVAITDFGGRADELARNVAENAGAVFYCDSRAQLGTAILDVARRRSEAVWEKLAHSPQGVISDFWIESLQAHIDAIADAAESENDTGGLQHRFDAILQSAAQPKLLVLLSNHQSPGSLLQSRVHALATRAGRGPFLVLDSGRFRENVEELTAAVAAMR